MEIIKVKLKDLKPYENNAKIHTKEQIEQIVNSIKQFGMNDPIGIWKDNTIIEGHGRYEALKQLGYKEVDCIRLDHLTNEERKAYTLAHNKLTLNTDFDFDLLEMELDSIEDIDMEDLGFENIDYSYIDDLLENEYVNADTRADLFSVTFNFDIKYKDQVLRFIKDNGKEFIVERVLEMIENA